MLSPKGISPLVAAVLLIAVTMTIAGALAYWASQFVQTQTTFFSNQTVSSECNFMKYQIYACSYDSNSTRINLILNNIGTVDMTRISAFVLYPNNLIEEKNLNATLNSGALGSFVVPNVTSDFTKIIVRSQCPETVPPVESVCR